MNGPLSTWKFFAQSRVVHVSQNCTDSFFQTVLLINHSGDLETGTDIPVVSPMIPFQGDPPEAPDVPPIARPGRAPASAEHRHASQMLPRQFSFAPLSALRYPVCFQVPNDVFEKLAGIPCVDAEIPQCLCILTYLIHIFRRPPVDVDAPSPSRTILTIAG